MTLFAFFASLLFRVVYLPLLDPRSCRQDPRFCCINTSLSRWTRSVTVQSLFFVFFFRSCFQGFIWLVGWFGRDKMGSATMQRALLVARLDKRSRLLSTMKRISLLLVCHCPMPCLDCQCLDCLSNSSIPMSNALSKVPLVHTAKAIHILSRSLMTCPSHDTRDDDLRATCEAPWEWPSTSTHVVVRTLFACTVSQTHCCYECVVLESQYAPPLVPLPTDSGDVPVLACWR